MREHGRTWALVLAAGDGTRLHGLTAAATGRPTPKQFCSLRGGRSLLGDALARARRLVPVERTVVVVAEAHRAWWAEELVDLPAENLVVQPRNRGTGVGILVPLLAILDRDPDARVIVVPSDHYVRRERALALAFSRALAQLEIQDEPVTLLGITPDAAESDYGWIVPGDEIPLSGTHAVRQFVEKPTVEVAACLRAEGGLWNSFLFAARAADLVALCRQRLGATVDALVRGLSQDDLAAVYETVEPADFSCHILQGAEAALRVLAVPRCGWTDLGTPDRVRDCLGDLPAPVTDERRSQPRLDVCLRAMPSLAG